MGGMIGTLTAISLAGLGPRDASYIGILGLPTLMMFAGMMTRSISGKGKIRGLVEFQAKNLGLWAGYAIGWSVWELLPNDGWSHRFGGELIMFTAALWALCACVGGAVAIVRTPSGPGDPDAPLENWRIKLADRLKKWIDVILVQSRNVPQPDLVASKG